MQVTRGQYFQCQEPLPTFQWETLTASNDGEVCETNFFKTNGKGKIAWELKQFHMGYIKEFSLTEN